MDEAEHINSIVALPGGHHNLGASRNWHFLIVPVWVLNGLSYVTLLGVTGEWRRLHSDQLDDFPSSLGERPDVCQVSDPAGQRVSPV